MARFYTNKHYQQKPEIDNSKVSEFFDIRAKKISDLDSMRAVMYQDRNPELVIQRDIEEKKKLLPKLRLNKKSRVLDVGCGTGRWLNSLDNNFCDYHGLDISKGFIEYAKKIFSNNNIRFSVASINDVTLNDIDETIPFDCLLCMGVLIYLNDCDLIKALNCIKSMMGGESVLIFREPIALNERLTLVNEYSEDMKQTYNAIYRTKEEILDFFSQYLYEYTVVTAENLFDNTLNNRVDTLQYYFILESKND